jgi:hypothetical protein
MFQTARRRRIRTAAAGIVVGIVAVAGASLLRAASADTPPTVHVVDTAAGAVDLASSTYADVVAAVTGASDVVFATGIDGLQPVDLGPVPIVTGPGNVVSVHHTATVGTLGTVDVLVTARWDDASTDVTPDVAVVVKASDVALSELNAAWAPVLTALQPQLPDAWVALSTATFTLPPVAGFSDRSIDITPGATLAADLDLAAQTALRRAARTLGSSASTLVVGGHLADSAAALFAAPTAADLAGLHLRATFPVPPAPWVTARAPVVDLTLPDVDGNPLPTVALQDLVTTTLGGATNTFSLDAAFVPAAFSGGATSVRFDQEGVLDPPFGFTWLHLSDTHLVLALAAGDDDATHVTASLTSLLAVTPSKTVGLTTNLVIDGSDVSAAFVVDAGDAVTIAELTGLLSNALGASLDAGSVGGAVSLHGISFEAATSVDRSSVTVRAQAVVENDPADLDVDVLVHAVKPTGAAARLLVGLRVVGDQADCTCIRLRGLVSGALGQIAGELELPAVDVVAVVPPGAPVADADLSETARQFLAAAPGGALDPQPDGVRLAGSLRVASLGSAVVDAFGWTGTETISVGGSVGTALSVVDGHFALGLTGVHLAATLPAPGAHPSVLPDWASFPSGLALHVDYDSGPSTLAVTVQSDVAVHVGGENVTAAVSVGLTRAPTTTTLVASAALGDWAAPFGQSWLGTLTDTSLTLTIVVPDGGVASASAVFTATDDLPAPLPTVTVTATVEFTGSTPSATVTLAIGSIAVDDVLAFIGQSSLHLPIALSLDSTTITVSVSPTRALFAVAAHTSLTWSGGGVGAGLLLTVEAADGQPPRFTAGLRLEGPGGGELHLSDLIPVPVDFTLPKVAFVYSSGALDRSALDLTPPEFEFLKPLYGCADDALPSGPAGDCGFTAHLPGNAFTFLGNVPLPPELSEPGNLLEQFGIHAAQGVRIQGSLPLLDGVGDIDLRLFLPEVVNGGTLPDFLQRVGFSLFLRGSVSPPSIAFGFTGELDLRMRQGADPTDDAAACTAHHGQLLTGGDDEGHMHNYCYDVIPLSGDATISVETSGLRVAIDFGLNPSSPDYVWQSPFGLEWLEVRGLRISLGVTVAPTGPSFDIGAFGNISIGGKQIYGAISIGVAVLPCGCPPFVRPDFRGVLAGSSTGIELNDLYLVYKAMAGAGAPAAASVQDLGLPNLALKNLEFKFSLVNDPALCLSPLLKVSADLYQDYTAPPPGTPQVTYDPCHPPPAPPTVCAERGDGCFAGVLFDVSLSGIIGQASVSGFDLGPLHSNNAVFDFALTPTDQHLHISGGLTIDGGIGSGHVDLSVTLQAIHFTADLSLFGVSEAYVDGYAGFGGAGQPFDLLHPQFDLIVKLRSSFGDTLNEALSEKLAPIADAAPVMADTWTALTGSGAALRDALDDLGVDIPAGEEPTAHDRLLGFRNGLALLGLPTSSIDPVLGLAGDATDLILGGYCTLVDGDADADGFSDFAGVPCSAAALLSRSLADLSGLLGQLTGQVIPGDADGFGALLDDLVDKLSAAAVPVEVECAQFDVALDAVDGAPIDDLGLALQIFGNDFSTSLAHWTFDVDDLDSNVVPLFDAVVDFVFGGPAAPGGSCTPPPPPPPSDATDSVSSGMTLTPSSADIHEYDTVLLSVAFDRAALLHSVTIDWGDGTAPQSLTAPAIAVVHRYDDDDPSGTSRDTKLVRVTDHATGKSATTTILVRNVKPADLVIDPLTVDEGSSGSLHATFTDTSPLDTHVGTWNFGDGSTASQTAIGHALSTSHMWLDDPAGSVDQYGGSLVLIDDDRGIRARPVGITVHNVAPTIGTLTLTPAVDEHGVATLVVPFSDPGTLDTFTVSVDWGDGSDLDVFSRPAGATSATRTHRYLDDDPSRTAADEVPVGVTVADDDGGSDTAGGTVTVRNVAPVVGAITRSAAAIDEDGSVTVTVPWTDAGTRDTATVTIDWGQGEGSTIIGPTTDPGVRSVQATHRYLDDDPTNSAVDSYAISVSVADDDRGSARGSTSVDVRDLAPVVAPLVLSATTIDEDGSVTVTVPWTDAGTRDTATLTIDWGQGEGSTTVGPTTDPSVRSLQATHRYLDDNPTASASDLYTIQARVDDDDTLGASRSATVRVGDVAPVVTIDAISAQDERGTVTVTGSYTDVGTRDTHTGRIDWGETPATPAPVALTLVPDQTEPWHGTFSATHVYGDNFTYTVKVDVVDDDTVHHAPTRTVLVRNVAPTVVIADAAGSSAVSTPAGSTFLVRGRGSLAINAGVTDPGSDDETIVWDWRDGLASTVTSRAGSAADGLPSPTGAARSITTGQSHAWSAPCLYNPTVTSTDDDHLRAAGDGGGNGVGSDATWVVVTGTDTRARISGYWYNQFLDGARNKTDLPKAQVECYRAIAAHLSSVFTERRALATFADVRAVLDVSQTSSDVELLDRQILTTWLNLANGSVTWTQMVDSDGNGTKDMQLHALLEQAEAARLSGTASRATLLAYKSALEAVNGGA